ncbi:ParB N-terminal domain-containing protein, partial [Salmonella enterica subsp. enterica serovar Infantis]|uniref:ParB N-terminal domain-containing protein n=1 Tax=Salmonella enterica TaxID=28901 RepID=UPI001CAA4FA0
RRTTELTHFLSELPEEGRIAAINVFRMAIRSVSPVRDEPVDCVLCVKNVDISPNDYNPNNVAPPEKKLLHKSIEQEGFTQPIVVVKANAEEYESVDGFHR